MPKPSIQLLPIETLIQILGNCREQALNLPQLNHCYREKLWPINPLLSVTLRTQNSPK